MSQRIPVTYVQPGACPVPLGGRRGPPCGQPALHVVRDWSRRSNADQRYYVCCDHAPGRRHAMADHAQEASS
jgi:hypothetical protein